MGNTIFLTGVFRQAVAATRQDAGIPLCPRGNDGQGSPCAEQALSYVAIGTLRDCLVRFLGFLQEREANAMEHIAIQEALQNSRSG